MLLTLLQAPAAASHADTLAPVVLALAVILVAAKLGGDAAERVGQPAVLGELVAGVAVGVSGLGLIDPEADTIRLFAEIGTTLHVLELWYDENPNLTQVDVVLGTGQTQGYEPFADQPSDP